MVPLSFVVCVSDDSILKANLLASPGLAGPDSPHEVILIHQAPMPPAGYDMGRAKAKHEWVIFAHQDVYLPGGWDTLARQLREAERRFGPIGVAGVYGVGDVSVPRDLTRHWPPNASVGWSIAGESCAMGRSCRRASPRSTSCC